MHVDIVDCLATIQPRLSKTLDNSTSVRTHLYFSGNVNILEALYYILKLCIPMLASPNSFPSLNLDEPT